MLHHKIQSPAASQSHRLPPSGVAGADRGATSATLPAWAQNDAAREIISYILLERPEIRYFDNGCSQWGGKEYRGKPANQLRKLYMDQLGALCGEEAVRYHEGKPFDELTRQINELMGAEQPDALIERLLSSLPGCVDLIGEGWLRAELALGDAVPARAFAVPVEPVPVSPPDGASIAIAKENGRG